MKLAKLKKPVAVLALGLGLFMAFLDTSIVNISIPTMMKYFKTDVSSVSWVLDAYLLVFAVLILAMGRLGDQFGRKLVYNLGLGIFVLGSLLCAISWDINWLIGFRAFQAIGAAIMLPITMAIIAAMFPPERRGAAMGLWGAIGITAVAIGPSLGGVIVEHLNWQWIFYINIPIGIIALALSRSSITESKDPLAPQKVDFLGIITFSIGVFSLVLAAIKGEDWGWSSGQIISLFVIAGVFLIIFAVVEKWQSQPMLELGLFRNRTFSNSSISQFMIGFGMLSSLFLLTLFLQNIMGYSVLKAAVAVTPVPGTALVIAPIAGRICDRIGPRIPGTLGMIALVLGIYLLSQLQADSGWGAVAWRSVIVGAGMGMANPAVAVAIIGATPAGKEGVGSGVLNTSRIVGMAMGIAICVALLSSAASTQLNEAKAEASFIITEDQQIPGFATGTILKEIENIEGLESMPDLASVAAENGIPQSELPHVEQLSQQISSVFRLHMTRAFKDVFPVSAIIVAFGVIPASLLRRLKASSKS